MKFFTLITSAEDLIYLDYNFSRRAMRQMPWRDPQVVGIPCDYTATGLLALEAHVYEP